MASESDEPDEFYDAEEATPISTNNVTESSGYRRLAQLQKTITDIEPKCRLADSKIPQDSSIAVERLQASSLIEKSLLDEEEILRKRLEEIEKKKREQKMEKQMAERKAAENLERRQKLEAMRRAIERGDPTAGLCRVQHPGGALGVPGGGDTLPHRCGSSSNIVQSVSEGQIRREAKNTIRLRLDGRHSSSAENLHNKLLTSAEHITPLCLNTANSDSVTKDRFISQRSTSSNRTISASACSPTSNEGHLYDSDSTDSEDEEPDIVKSTKDKSGSLRRGQSTPGPTPVAPPRRRKAKNNAEAEIPDSRIERINEVDAVISMAGGAVGGLAAASADDELFSDEGGEVGGRVNLLSELERTFSLPGALEGVEPVLDINSATKGHRVVTLCEEQFNRQLPAFPLADELLAAAVSCPPDPIMEGGEADSVTQHIEREQVAVLRSKGGEEEGGVEGSNSNRHSNASTMLASERVLQGDGEYVVNLDTGESLLLNSAEEKLPQGINPLSLHIMRRTKEYSDSTGGQKREITRSEDELSQDAVCMPKSLKPPGQKKKTKFRKLLGKTVNKIRKKGDEVFHGDESGGASDEDDILEGRRTLRVKASHGHKGTVDFDLLVLVQELFCPKAGAVWTMKFSHCGRLLATGGQDCLLRVWVLRDAFNYFNEMRLKFNDAGGRISPTASTDSISSQFESASSEGKSNATEVDSMKLGAEAAGMDGGVSDSDGELEHVPFMKKPFCVYTGHSADLLDVSWSKNYFILSSSMDKTVRLWHVSRQECLCCFQHIDFVTAIAFHPKDDRYFLSGSLDGKLRLWNIPDKKVALWNEVSGTTKLITAANFCLGGRFAVVGTYDGRCVFYSTEQLKYYTQIHVRSTRGRNARGRKITGVEPFPGEDKILVTSNDSRIRLYDLRDLTLTCKYKGCTNNSSQIKASFSNDGKYITCGSEDQFVYIWRTMHDLYKFTSARKDRNDYWESVKAHNAVVTNAIFAPCPELIIKAQFDYVDPDDKDNTAGVRGEVLVSADYTGAIKVFLNKFKPPPS